MSGAVIIANQLPASIVVLKDETMAEVARLTSEAKAPISADVDSLAKGNTLYRAIDAFAKGIKEHRMALTRPIDDYKDAIIEAERKATLPLAEAKDDLGKRLFAVQKEMERQRLEAERKAREEAEERARAERARLESERQAIIKRQQEKHAAAEARAKEESELFGGAAQSIPEPEVPPVAIVVPVVDAVAIPAPLPKQAVRGNTRKVLRIVDSAKIPREVGGVACLVPDVKAIEKLLKAGVAVPGAILESVEGFASVGSR